LTPETHGLTLIKPRLGKVGSGPSHPVVSSLGESFASESKNAASHVEIVGAIHRVIITARAFSAWRMETRHSLWQLRAMIEFRLLSDDHPDLAYSPLLRAALLTLQYAQEHGAIGLTKTNAFKRVFVHWAVEHFEWPGKSAEEMFRYNKVINEYEFSPLEVLHFLLISLRLGRHFKGEFRLTKLGAELAHSPGRLFTELIPFYVFEIDHASYARFDDRPFGKWDVWMNVINVEADHGTTERALFVAFYGEEQDWDTAGWREMAAFSSFVLRPLEWAGLLMENREERAGKHVHHVFKTPLWRSALKLDTDEMLYPISVQ